MQTTCFICIWYYYNTFYSLHCDKLYWPMGRTTRQQSFFCFWSEHWSLGEVSDNVLWVFEPYKYNTIYPNQAIKTNLILNGCTPWIRSRIFNLLSAVHNLWLKSKWEERRSLWSLAAICWTLHVKTRAWNTQMTALLMHKDNLVHSKNSQKQIYIRKWHFSC